MKTKASEKKARKSAKTINHNRIKLEYPFGESKTDFRTARYDEAYRIIYPSWKRVLEHVISKARKKTLCPKKSHLVERAKKIITRALCPWRGGARNPFMDKCSERSRHCS